MQGEVTVHHGQCPIGISCRLGGQGQLLCVWRPRRQRGDSSLESTWTSLRVREAARTSRTREVVVHHGPQTTGPGCRLGRTEDVVRHYGLSRLPPGLAGRLGGQGQLRRSRSPRHQLEKLQLWGLQDLAASPRGVAHVVCRARSRYITGSGPSSSAADLGDRASSCASGARDASGETPAWKSPGQLGLPFFRGTGCRYQMVNTSVQNPPAK